MRERFRDSMNWLHTWSGLVVGWVLFTVFFTGTLAYFQYEITDWMQPELNWNDTPTNAIQQAQSYLNEQAPNSSTWLITLPTERFSTATLYWRKSEAGQRGFNKAIINDKGQTVAVRDSKGGAFLYRFHFDFYYIPAKWARWIVGICSMLMLVAIVTGVIIHKKIFKDFFTLQLGKGHKSWLDAHTLSSVFALPFHLMITYTGLVTLMFMYLGAAVSYNFDNRNAFFSGLSQPLDIPAATDISAPMMPLEEIYLDARNHLGLAPIVYISINHPGDQNATIRFAEEPIESLTSNYRTLLYSAVSGQLISESAVKINAERTRRLMINLHSGRFADTYLRWLYFLSGLVGTVMIGTGLLLWFKKRSQRLASNISKGHNLVNNLNVGFLLGLPIALASYFIANRLFPVTLNNRSEAEIFCFFCAWLILLVYPLVRGVNRTWLEGSYIAALSFITLPLLSMLSVKRNLLTYQYPRDNTLLAIDITLLFTGTIFLLCARYINIQSNKESAVTTNKNTNAIGRLKHDN